MNTKIFAVLLFAMVLATPAFAAMTLTWVSPADSQTYNNTPANATDANLTFTITDDNATLQDHNLTVKVLNTAYSTVTTIVSDMNVRTDGTDQNCWLTSAETDLDEYNCTIYWDMPTDTSLSEGTYYIDANVESVFGLTDGKAGDVNAIKTIVINNHLSTAASTRALLLVISIIAAAALMIFAVLSITMFGADVAKTAILTVAGAIAIAVILTILGAILVLI